MLKIFGKFGQYVRSDVWMLNVESLSISKLRRLCKRNPSFRTSIKYSPFSPAPNTKSSICRHGVCVAIVCIDCYTKNLWKTHKEMIWNFEDFRFFLSNKFSIHKEFDWTFVESYIINWALSVCPSTIYIKRYVAFFLVVNTSISNGILCNQVKCKYSIASKQIK